MPVLKQRLIFQGKLLQNLEKLKTYKISDESVIHLVAKSMEDSSSNNNNNNGNTSSSTTNNQNIASNLESSETRINIEDIFPSLIELPILRSNRRQRRRRVPHFDISECFESMHQNINTVQNLLNCKAKFDESSLSQTRTITAYDLSKSKYEVGQWVDVKDTIDQWLEAQVIAIRPNQAYVHYNGWGVRWDEWIDFSSPRIAPFKTYTMQSPSSVFLSPYPHQACDANVESQPRSIDTFYYMEKTFNYLGELGKIVDYMSKIRKKNINQGRCLVRKDDFETESKEARDKESQSLPRNTNQISLNNYDYELLFFFTQLIPLMDRCGRLLSDVSLQISHLLLNPSLYPQLLLGYNNQEVSDSMSCTSGYSIFTNEGSTVSGFNQMLFLSEQTNMNNNLQRNSGIINSNQMVNNYSINSLNVNTNQTSSVTNPNLGNNGNSNLTSTNVLINGNNNPNEGVNRTSNFNTDSFPKINLQVSSMLSPGEVAMFNGYNGLFEPNIDIYVHTLVSNNSNNINSNSNTNTSSVNNILNTGSNPSTNVNSNNTGIQTVNTVNRVNQINITNSNTSNNVLSNNNNNNNTTSSTTPIQNLSNFNNQIFSENDLVENRREGSISNTGSVTNSANHPREGNSNSNNMNGLLENLMNMMGQRRRGSVASDTSNNSNRLGWETLNNLNQNTRTRFTSTRTNNNLNSNNIGAQVTSGLNIGSLYRETGSQTDIPLNLLLNKDNK